MWEHEYDNRIWKANSLEDAIKKYYNDEIQHIVTIIKSAATNVYHYKKNWMIEREKSMTKKNIVLVILLVIIIGLTLWVFDLKETLKYERESYGVTLLNYEANEFCMQVAQFYYNKDYDRIKEYYIEGESVEIEYFKDIELAFLSLKQTKYISDSIIPQASYEVQYRVISDDELVRQSIMVVKNQETKDWKFQVLDYK